MEKSLVSEVAEFVSQKIISMTEEEVRKTESELRQMSKHSFWVEYRLKDALLFCVQNRLMMVN